MEGRVQGDPRPPGRSPVRLSAAVVVALFLASAVVGAVVVISHVEDAVTRYSKLTDAERRHAAGDRLHLKPAPFDRFRARLHPRQRYAVDVPEGALGPFITRGAVVRAYSAFYFLPAIQARRAPLVFHYRFR